MSEDFEKIKRENESLKMEIAILKGILVNNKNTIKKLNDNIEQYRESFDNHILHISPLSTMN